MPPLAVRRHAHGDHQGVQALQPVRLHRHADLRGERWDGRQPAARAPPSRRSASKLHTYTIVDAISDKNVLPFRIDYVNTIKLPEGIADKQVSAIDTEKALLAPERMRQVVDVHAGALRPEDEAQSEHYIARRASASAASTRSSPPPRSRRPSATTPSSTSSSRSCRRTARLKIGLIYSYAANEAVEDGYLDEEGFETDALDQSSRDFLEARSRTTTRSFGTSFDTSADKFQNYYKDLSLRLKNREIDLVIVVNMFLTGFDATTLNTLFVDKNLRAHGLIQAYSRTNRILNSVKTYGNIVCFRDLEEETNDAIALFGNKDACGIVLLKPYGEYYDEYAEKVSELLAAASRSGSQIVGESAQKDVHRPVRSRSCDCRTS